MTSDEIPKTKTRITSSNLLERGYRHYPPNPVIDRFDCFYQRLVRDEKEWKLYFINFRRWTHEGKITWDVQLCCDSDTGGYLWATIKESTIEDAEERIQKLWEACGGVRYE